MVITGYEVNPGWYRGKDPLIIPKSAVSMTDKFAQLCIEGNRVTFKTVVVPLTKENSNG